MKKGQNYKKAEVSSSFLVTTVLLVIGFIGVLIFFFNLNDTGSMDRTICHNSVIFRATLPVIGQDLVSLKCQTNKICITSGKFLDITKKKGECSDFKGETGITIVKVKSLEDIEKIYAQEIYACWQMMGEGKVSLFNKVLANNFALGDVYPSCVICSRIAFDDVVLKSLDIKPEEINVQEYMLTHKIPGKQISYFEYIAGEGGDYNIADGLIKVDPAEAKAKVEELKGPGEDSLKEFIDTISPVQEAEAIEEDLNLRVRGTAIVFSQISAPKNGDVFKNWALATVGIAGIGAKIGAGPLFKVYAILALLTQGVEQANTVWQRSVTAGYCGDISVGTEARDGCSIVRAVPYNAEDIASYCAVIESIP